MDVPTLDNISKLVINTMYNFKTNRSDILQENGVFVFLERSVDIIRDASVNYPFSIRFGGCLYGRWRSDDIAGAACAIYFTNLR